MVVGGETPTSRGSERFGLKGVGGDDMVLVLLMVGWVRLGMR